MNSKLNLLIPLFIFISANIFCGQPKDSAINKQDTTIVISKNDSLIGIAANEKPGAVILVDSMTYFIDLMDSWPDKMLDKKVIVYGDIVKRLNPYVFIAKTPEERASRQGIPVDNKEEYERMKYNYFIIKTSYKEVK